MSKSRSITMRLDAELEEKLKRGVEQNRRNVSDFARITLSDALDKPAQPEGPKLEIAS